MGSIVVTLKAASSFFLEKNFLIFDMLQWTYIRGECSLGNFNLATDNLSSSISFKVPEI